VPAEPLRRTRGAEPGHLVSRPFADGDQVLLIDVKKRRYLVTLTAGGEFHTHAGVVAHDDLIGAAEASSVRSSRGSAMLAIRPTLAEFVLKMPRGAQVIYPKDLGPILMLADIHPGARVLESGVGSGALSMTLVRAGRGGAAYELVQTANRPEEVATFSARRRCRHGRTATFTRASTRPTSTEWCSTRPSRGGRQARGHAGARWRGAGGSRHRSAQAVQPGTLAAQASAWSTRSRR
jgi:hypothetical protein